MKRLIEWVRNATAGPPDHVDEDKRDARLDRAVDDMTKHARAAIDVATEERRLARELRLAYEAMAGTNQRRGHRKR